MQNRTVTGELLVYYSDLSAHHRLMMIGFGTVYFGINQILVMTPVEIFTNISQRFPVAIVISGGLLTIFVIAAMLHHACHFCSTSAMKAVMATETHYQHLPKSTAQLDTFQQWTFRTSKDIRTFVAVPTASVYIVCSIFGLLALTNSYIFLEISKSLLSNRHIDTAFLFGAFIFGQIIIGIYYLYIFVKHLKYLTLAKRELAMVMKSSTRDDFDKSVKEMQMLPSSHVTDTFILDSKD